MSPSYHFPSAFETAQSRQEYIYRPITFSSASEIGPATCDGMGILTDSQNKRSPSSSSTSPCANLRAAYHNCFSRWYSEKFVKGQWDKEECVSEWQKYKACLSQHLEDKQLSRFLEAEGPVSSTIEVASSRTTKTDGAPTGSSR
ncbi:hypothetical protein L3X38_007075 [Prunus dulcis]|uniref:Uncharacterized protein n=1 Tax=Prunus dulcis TaxID=3755 RepID=A0AAD4ZTZ5_PRUDU|nr:hypothetical protein L3X38_007075 [Prunus dulcis]